MISEKRRNRPFNRSITTRDLNTLSDEKWEKWTEIDTTVCSPTQLSTLLSSMNFPQNSLPTRHWDSAEHQKALVEERNIELIAPKKSGKTASQRKQDQRPLRGYKKTLEGRTTVCLDETIPPCRDALGGKVTELLGVCSARVHHYPAEAILRCALIRIIMRIGRDFSATE